MSGVRYYTDLLEDVERLRGMRRSIETMVRPGDRVLEIGTGLGTFAFWAAEAGASEVVAVERDPVVHLAESMAVAKGVGDSVTFLRGDFAEVDVSGPFDVLIFEDLGGLVLDPARARLMEAALSLAGPDARLIPSRVRCAAVPVTCPELGERLVPPLASATEFGLDAALLRDFLRHEALRTSVSPGHFIGAPSVGPEVGLSPIPTAGDLRIDGTWTVSAPVAVHAVVAWFDLEVAPGRWVSNGPDGEPQPWGQYAFPVDPPLQVQPDVELEVKIGPGGEASTTPGPWRWTLRAGTETRAGDELAGRPFGSDDLDG